MNFVWDMRRWGKIPKDKNITISNIYCTLFCGGARAPLRVGGALLKSGTVL